MGFERFSIPEVPENRNQYICDRGGDKNTDHSEKMVEQECQWNVDSQHSDEGHQCGSQGIAQGIENCGRHHNNAPGAIGNGQNHQIDFGGLGDVGI